MFAARPCAHGTASLQIPLEAAAQMRFAAFGIAHFEVARSARISAPNPLEAAVTTPVAAIGVAAESGALA